MAAFFLSALEIGRKEVKEIKVSHQANLIEMLFSTKGLTKHFPLRHCIPLIRHA